MKTNYLLFADAVINLALGLLLLVFPVRLVEILGAPLPDDRFYASILGAIFFGIGLALLLERYRSRTGIRGLGLGGAICINLCGAGWLIVWLLFGRLDLPIRGMIFLWALAVLVLGVSVAELFSIFLKKGTNKGLL